MAPLALALEIDGAGAHPAAWRRAATPPDQHLDPQRLRAARRGGRARRLHAGHDRRRPPAADARRRRPVASARSSGPPSSPRSPACSASCRSCRPPTPSRSTSRRQLAALDHISHGRAGWIVASTPDPAAARAWRRPPSTDADGVAPGGRRRRCTSRARCGTRGRTTPSSATSRPAATSIVTALHYIDFEGDDLLGQGPGHRARARRRATSSCSAAPDLVDPAPVDVALVTGRDVAARRRGGRRRGDRRRGASPRSRSPSTRRSSDGAERVADLERATPWPDAGRLRYVGSGRRASCACSPSSPRTSTACGCTRSSSTRTSPCCPSSSSRGCSSSAPAPGRSPGASLRATLGLERPANQFAAAAAVTGG